MSAVAVGVYVLIGEGDRVLYVGASRDVHRRVRQHRSKRWWDQVVDVELYPMETWEQALHVEKNLIRELAPRHNRQSNNLVLSLMTDFFATAERRVLP